MPKQPNPELIDDENPGWTEEDFARARSTGSDWPLYVEETLRDWRARHDTQRKAAS